MKPDANFYDIPSLMKRWADYDITESELLQQGESGKLQFSMWIAPPINILYSLEIDCYCYENGTDIPLKPTHTNYLTCDNPELFKVTNQTILQLLSKTRAYNDTERNEPSPSTIASILPNCDTCEQECPRNTNTGTQRTEGKIRDTKYIDENGDEIYPAPINITELLTVTARDLVVTIDEVKRFEKEHLKTKPGVHPCTDPDHPGYSPHLAITLEIWESVYIKKEGLDFKRCQQAGLEYINTNYPDEFNSKNTTTGEPTDGLARKKIVASTALSGHTDVTSWNKYRKKYQSSE